MQFTPESCAIAANRNKVLLRLSWSVSYESSAAHEYTSYLPRHLACNPRPFRLPFIPQASVNKVGLKNQQREVPNQRDRVEEVGIAAASVQPEVVERRAQESGVE